MAYDVIIKGGVIFDGSGAAGIVGDVGIKGGGIVALGSLGEEGTPIVLNAHQKYVTPGFIDVTNHSDTHLTLFRHPGQESMLMQGVTTVIGGNCGASLAPLASRDALGAIQKWVTTEGVNINWNSMDEFLSEMERRPLGVNFGTLAGYGTLRRGVIGNDIRALDQTEREKIKFLVSESIRAGSFGLSCGLSYGHERVSATEEIIDVAQAARGGIIALHLRSEGSGLVAAVNEAIRIGRETGVPVHISHFKAIGKKSWPLVEKVFSMLETARSSGVAITFDVSPYATTGSLLYLLLPAWAREGGFAELFKQIDDREKRSKMIAALREHTLHYEKILIIAAEIKMVVGHTISEIARQTGLTHEEAVIELIRANHGRVKILGRTVSQKNTDRAAADERSFVSSDGEGYSQEEIASGILTHPRSFGAFPHFWHRMVQDTKKLMPEAAIKKMTGAPAALLGIKDRGGIAKGMVADVAVFDPALFRDRAKYRSPFRYAAGIEHVLVGGVLAVKDGMLTGARTGRVLRRAS